MIPQFYLSDLTKVALEARADVRDRDSVRRYLQVREQLRTMLEGVKK